MINISKMTKEINKLCSQKEATNQTQRRKKSTVATRNMRRLSFLPGVPCHRFRLSLGYCLKHMSVKRLPCRGFSACVQTTILFLSDPSWNKFFHVGRHDNRFSCSLVDGLNQMSVKSNSVLRPFDMMFRTGISSLNKPLASHSFGSFYLSCFQTLPCHPIPLELSNHHKY